jgi:hypothetical protein
VVFSFFLFFLTRVVSFSPFSRHLNNITPHIIMMKNIILVLALLIACAAAFAPIAPMQSQQRMVMTALSAVEQEPTPMSLGNPMAAALALGMTMAPIAAANAVDDATAIAWGAGLVATVVAFAVGFSVGYGTLSKL